MRWIGGVSLGTVLGIGTALAWADAPKAPAAVPAKADPKAAEFFETKIRPLLSQQCFACHGDKLQKGKLRLDTAADFFRGGETGAVVSPGHPEKSALIDSISYTKELKMPPQGKLKPQQIADLTTWVKMGAPWPGYDPAQAAAAAPKAGGWQITDEHRKFWAFRPVVDPTLPAVKNKAWVKSPIDAFILAGLEKKGLKPAPAADKRTLIRRVTFDVTGLPPTPEEIDAFLADTTPDAFAKVVDRLLASPAYGERWGRHWLDIARYADSNGLDENTAFANAYRYRDYVIRAFNADKPYDQFVREQLAGDLLPASQDDQANADRLTATGFLVLGPKVLAEPDKQKMLMDIVDEQIDTTSKAFMGMTLACARCHDHKFDPLATKDYYALAGIFKSTRAMKSLNTVAQAYERPLSDKDAAAKMAAHQQSVAAKQDAARAAADQLNGEISTRLVNDTDKYLLLGLQASVAAASDLGTPDLKRPGAIVLEAETFKRGDVKVTSDGQPQGFGYIESAGRSAAFTEYEINVPTGGDFELSLRYASDTPRPLQISLDGKTLKTGAAGGTTGGFGAGEQQWFFETLVNVPAGKHLVRLDQRASSLPHVDKIVLIPVLGAPVAASGARTRKPSDLAQEAGVDAELLRRSASYLLASQARGDDPVFGPWHQLSALPTATFAADAQKLVAGWKSSGKLQSWTPLVAQLFAGEAPKSLAETAGRYKTLFAQVNAAWVLALQTSKPAPTKLANAEQEAVRQALYAPKGAFGLGQIERLYPAQASANLKKLKDEAEALAKATPEQPLVLAVEEASQIGDVKVHIRGNHLTLGDNAPRIFLRVVAGDEEKQTPVPANHSGRLELAQWLTDPAHPLTARVMVNRIWEHHFGQGIVRTPDNFGKLGDRPSHPELLDWLAKRFVEKGWSVKAMHRMVLLSNAYQMSTVNDPKAALADPENRLLWHFNRRRLEVEALRDSIFAVAGTLDRTPGGSLLNTPNFGYVTNDQSGNGAQYDSPRRAIYLPVIRNAVYDVFQVFDFVEPSFPNGARAITTVAPQALFLMNGQLVLDQSTALAKRLLEQPGDDAARLKVAYLRAFGRAPAADEVAKAQTYITAYADRLTAKEPDAEKRRRLAWQSFCQILFASNEFVYVN